MENNRKKNLLVNLLKQEAQMATICTEPGAIAFAAAKARSLAGGSLIAIEVTLSPGVMKNSLFVGLPGTSRRGPHVAAALGAAGGDPELGLEVLREIHPKQVEEAHRLIDENRIKVSCDFGRDGVYVAVSVATEKHSAKVTIEGSHSMITEVVKDEIPIVVNSTKHISIQDLQQFTFRELIEETLQIDYEEFSYLREGALLTLSLSQQEREDATIRSEIMNLFSLKQGSKRLGDDLFTRVHMFVSKAVLARMEGINLPVLTSAGSGNQGIAVSVPIMAVGELVGVNPVAQSRALLLAHVINLFIKAFTGEVSSTCGAVSAGSGVAGGVCWLLGGDIAQIEEAVHIVLGTLYGMVCDGAKASCALKCAVGAVEGIVAGQLARSKCRLARGKGIVDQTTDETVRRIEALMHKSLKDIDKFLIKSAGYC